MFHKLFGKNKNASGGKGVSPQEGIQKLREMEEMLRKKSDYLEKKIEQEMLNARKAGTKNKKVALASLKRKNRYQTQLNQIDGTLSTIEYQREALESATTNAEVLKVMGTAAKALKMTHKDLDTDKVHDLMDDIAEQNDLAQEITEAIANPIGFNQTVDEDELLAELDQLEQENLDEHLLDVGKPGSASIQLPTVPDQPLPAGKSQAAKGKDEDEMAALQAWAM